MSKCLIEYKEIAFREERDGWIRRYTLAMFQGHGRSLPKVRQDGELHIPAFMAALEAYKKHEGEAEDASRQMQEYIAFAAALDPKKYWDGVYNERWINHRQSRVKHQACRR